MLYVSGINKINPKKHSLLTEGLFWHECPVMCTIALDYCYVYILKFVSANWFLLTCLLVCLVFLLFWMYASIYFGCLYACMPACKTQTAN